MPFFQNLKLSTKALIPPVLMALCFASAIAFSAWRLSEVSAQTAVLVKGAAPATTSIVRAGRMNVQLAFDVYRMLSYDGDSAEATAAAEDLKNTKTKGDNLFEEAMQLYPPRAAAYKSFKDGFDEIAKLIQKPAQIGLDTPGWEHGSTLKPQELDLMAEGSRQIKPIDQMIIRLGDDMAAFNTARTKEDAEAAEALVDSANWATWMMVLSASCAAIFGLWFTKVLNTGMIFKPLRNLGAAMEKLTNGELSAPVEGLSRTDGIGSMAKSIQFFKEAALDKQRVEAEANRQREASEAERRNNEAVRAKMAAEQAEAVRALAVGLEALAKGNLYYRIKTAFASDYESLRANFNEAIAQLEKAMRTVVVQTEELRSGGAEINIASNDLAERTELQASTLKQTAAALNQVTARVKQTADNANSARKTVAVAKTEAEESGLVVNDAVGAMHKIEESSQKIGQIIGVIDEIAFQTNLLALNAGVEAARAGEAGKGFAVVALEVRALAQRSADAAKDIKNLISASSHQVKQGVDLVGETGKALVRIVTQVSAITGAVDAIAASSQDQANDLLEINTAVNGMDIDTQKNAAMVEETSVASQSLSEGTNALSDLVTHFKVGGEPRFERAA